MAIHFGSSISMLVLDGKVTSRVRVGRGSDEKDQFRIWAGAVMQKTLMNGKKVLVPTDNLTDGWTD